MTNVETAMAEFGSKGMFVVRCIDDDYPACMKDEVYDDLSLASQVMVRYKMNCKEDNDGKPWAFTILFVDVDEYDWENERYYDLRKDKVMPLLKDGVEVSEVVL